MKPSDLEVGKLYWSPDVDVQNHWFDVMAPTGAILVYVKQEVPTTFARSLYVFLTPQGTKISLTAAALYDLKRKLK